MFYFVYGKKQATAWDDFHELWQQQATNKPFAPSLSITCGPENGHEIS